MSGNQISIIIPLFDRKDLIRETIDSLLLQTHGDFQCIIIDDHSTDNSLEAAREHLGEDDRFLLKKRVGKTKGAPVCRNEGIDLATGKYTMFLDSDDLLDPECLEKRLRSIQENQGKDFYVFNVAYFGDNNYIAEYLGADTSAPNDIGAFLSYTGGWLMSSTVFRSSFLKGNHYFDEEALSWQDVEFHIRAIAKTDNYQKFSTALPDVYIRSSEQPGITASSWSFDKIYSRIRLYLKIEKILKTDDYRKIFFFLYFKYLEMAARTLPTAEYRKLRDFWLSEYKYLKAASLRMLKYIDLQSFLSGNRMNAMGAVLYRVIRKFPGVNLVPSRRRVKMQEPIDVKVRFSRFEIRE